MRVDDLDAQIVARIDASEALAERMIETVAFPIDLVTYASAATTHLLVACEKMCDGDPTRGLALARAILDNIGDRAILGDLLMRNPARVVDELGRRPGKKGKD